MSFDVGIDIKANADLAATSQADAALKQLNQTVKDGGEAVKTWNQFVGERMGPYMQELGSHGAAIQKIAAEWKDYKASLEQGSQTIQNTSAAAKEAAGDLGQLESVHGSMGRAALPLRAGLSEIVQQLGLTGPAAHVAGEAMLGLSEGFTMITAGALAAGVGIGALIESIKFVKETGKQIDESFDPKNLTKTNDEIQNLQKNISQRGTTIAAGYVQIGKAIGAALGFADKDNMLTTAAAYEKLAALSAGQTRARLDLTQQLTDKIKNQADLIGKTMPQAIEVEATQAKQALIEQNKQWGLSIDQLHGLETEVDKLKGAKLAEDIRKSNLAIDAMVSGLRQEEASLTLTGNALNNFNTRQKIHAIQTSELARAWPDAVKGAIDYAAALGRLKNAQDNIKGGQQGIEKFQQNFGVQFDVNKQQAGQQLAQNFVAVFNQMKDDRGAETQLNQAFASMIQQAVAMGLPNIGGLLTSAGMSESDLAQLKQTLSATQVGVQQVDEAVDVWGRSALGSAQKIGTEIQTKLVPVYGTDLVAAIDKSSQTFFRWGTDFESAQKKITEQAANIGNTLQANFQQAANVVDDVARKIAGIPDVSKKTIIVDVQYTGGMLPGLEQEVQRGTGVDLGTRVWP